MLGSIKQNRNCPVNAEPSEVPCCTNCVACLSVLVQYVQPIAVLKKVAVATVFTHAVPTANFAAAAMKNKVRGRLM